MLHLFPDLMQSVSILFLVSIILNRLMSHGPWLIGHGDSKKIQAMPCTLYVIEGIDDLHIKSSKPYNDQQKRNPYTYFF